LDADVGVGDVIIAAEVNEFQANSKAESVADGYEIRYSGRHWTLAFAIREAITHFEFSGATAFAVWRTQVEADFDQLEIPNKSDVCSPSPSIHVGPIASGNIVAASTAFVGEVKRINRKFLAIDMEAAGVAKTATDRIRPIPCIIFRGISDQANEQKKGLDAQGKGIWRRYAVRNATSLLRNLLTWPGFLIACGLSESDEQETDVALARQTVSMLQRTLGGAWLVGVTFGLYSHGPSVANKDSVVPMDVNRLRTTDANARMLLDRAEAVKIEFLATRDISKAVQQFSQLANQYADHVAVESARLMLANFDRVVTDALSPSTAADDEMDALMLEAQRLDEEVGPAAAVDLLWPFADVHPRVRERLV
jgi:nucleoside phosphorylase